MKAADTNILIRAITGDDAAQGLIAARVIAAGVFLPVTVILETEWVLRSKYRFPRVLIADTLADLLDAPDIHVANETLVRWAVDRYRAGADFADMLHLAAAPEAEAFVTFDRDLTRDAGDAPPVPVEIAA